MLNTLRLRQNGCRFADDTFKRIFLNENVIISIKISLKFVPKGPINNNPSLVQKMAWRRSGDKPLSEPMVVSLLTHICVTRPPWVNGQQVITLTNGNLVYLQHYASVWAPFHKRFFHCNSNSMENSLCCHPSCNEVVAMKFCTWQDSCAVVACA